jgi:hypothetical protein
MPGSLEEELNLVGADRGQQVHSGMRGSLGKQAAVFHGQGGQADTAKEELALYFRRIVAALHPVLQESDRPLLLAMVEYEAPIFREVCSYRHLAKETLAGNFDRASEPELHALAQPLAGQIFDRAQEKAAARYGELAGTPRASDRLETILPAALEGRVETLFVDCRATELGVYHPAKRFIGYGDRDGAEMEDLLDRVAVESVLHDSVVYAVPRERMPCDATAAAIFRY